MFWGLDISNLQPHRIGGAPLFGLGFFHQLYVLYSGGLREQTDVAASHEYGAIAVFGLLFRGILHILRRWTTYNGVGARRVKHSRLPQR